MKITCFKDLEVYNVAFDAAMKIFEASKLFPKEERYSLTDQMRRSSRSVCANIAEAFSRRIYPKSFISKLNESEGEAAETQAWLAFSLQCGYISREFYNSLNEQYFKVIGKLITMSNHPENWCFPNRNIL